MHNTETIPKLDGMVTRSKAKTWHYSSYRQYPEYHAEDSVSLKEVTTQIQKQQANEQHTKTA